MLSLFKRLIPTPIKKWVNIRRREQDYVRRFALAEKGTHLPIFLFQPGKVGSMSLYTSLKQIYPGPVIHAHSLFEPPLHLGIELMIRWLNSGKPLSLICMIREPISRNISGFFESFEEYVGIPFSESSHQPEELCQLFLELYNHMGMHEWFHEELHRGTGIDVLEHPVHSPGYQRMDQGVIRFLLLKTELPDIEKIRLVSEFLSLPKFPLHSVNVAEKKPYAKMYQDVKTLLKIPEPLLLQITSAPLIRHFYTPQEIEDMNIRWKASIPSKSSELD
ncbi:MAG: putative capsular polysaccharide synthesis family protein [Candidatus Sumerlaeia bacterium]|nr:putative capsular polysaccharide synthesis family protein [Candidatus Sumerlaeia bacterium]